jgi:hypothetical protein
MMTVPRVASQDLIARLKRKTPPLTSVPVPATVGEFQAAG